MANKIKLAFEFLNMLKHPKKLLTIYKEHELKKTNHKKLYDLFYADFLKYNALSEEEEKKAKEENFFPCLHDNTGNTEIEASYFYQDAWAFERIYQQKPKKHIDIGSHHKFVAHLSKITDLTMVDIRPFSLPMESIHFIEGSILSLPFESGSIESLSSLCVIEHIGLGRYGDPLDPNGSEKAFKEIDRVLKSGAHFYMSVPIENENKIYFNAHRAFNQEYLLKDILINYTVIDIRYIHGKEFTQVLHDDFSVGCFHLQKK